MLIVFYSRQPARPALRALRFHLLVIGPCAGSGAVLNGHTRHPWPASLLSLSLSPHMSTALKWTGAGYVSVPLAAWDTGVPMQFARHSVWNSLSLSPSKLVCTDSVIRYTYIPDCCTVLYPPPPSLSLFAFCQFVLYQSVSAP